MIVLRFCFRISCPRQNNEVVGNIEQYLPSLLFLQGMCAWCNKHNNCSILLVNLRVCKVIKITNSFNPSIKFIVFKENFWPTEKGESI